MSDVVFKLVADPSQFIAGVNVADASQAKLNKSIEELGKDSNKAYDNAGKGAKDFGNETKNVETKTKSLKAQVRELKAELANATDPKEVERLARAVGKLEDQIGDASDAAAVFATDSPFEAVGNAVGSISTKLRNLDFKGAADQSRLLIAASKSITFKDAIDTVKDLGTTLMNVGKALLTNPLFILAAAIAAIVYVTYEAVTAFTKLGTQTETLNKSLEDSKKNIEELGRAQQDYMVKSAIANGQLTKEQGERVRTELKQSQQRKDLAKKYSEDIRALAKELEVDLGDLQKGRFKENYTGDINNLTARKRFNKEALKLEKQLLIDSILLARSQAQEKLSVLAEQNKAAEEKKLEEQKKINEKYKQNQEAFNAALLELFKKAQAAELEGLTGQAKIDRQKQIAEAELKQFQESIIKKQVAAGKGNKLSTVQLEQFKQLQLSIDRKYNQDSFALELQAIQDKSALRIKEAQNLKTNLSEKQKIFDLETQIQTEQVNALRKPKGISEQDFEKQKQIAILNIKKKAAEDSLNLKLNQVDAETNLLIQQAQAEIALLNVKGDANSLAEAKRIEQTLGVIELSGEKQKQLIIAQTQNLGIELTKETDKLNKELQSFKINWADIFGVTDQDFNSIKSNTARTITEVKKVIASFLDSQDATLKKELDVINEKKKVRDSEISSLESALQSQKDLKDAGYANDYERLQQELADKRAQEAQAMADELAIKKEQEKLAKERIMVQQAQQLSSLVTAAAEIYASVATAGPLGILAGTVAIGAMLASFAYAQGQASAAINAADSSFAEGGYTGDGGKYEEAGTVHKGEFVNKQETTKKYRTLLEGMHTEDNAKIELGLRDLLKNTGVSLPDLSNEISSKKNSLKKAEINSYFSKDNTALEKRIMSLESHLIKLVNQGSENIIMLSNGDQLIKKGSLTRVIRKK